MSDKRSELSDLKAAVRTANGVTYDGHSASFRGIYINVVSSERSYVEEIVRDYEDWDVKEHPYREGVWRITTGPP